MTNTIPLMDVIMGGESRKGNGYDIVNTNAYGRPYKGTPITQLSLDDVILIVLAVAGTTIVNAAIKKIKNIEINIFVNVFITAKIV